MREYGWTYGQYMIQPIEITEAAHRKMEIERKLAKQREDESRASH